MRCGSCCLNQSGMKWKPFASNPRPDTPPNDQSVQSRRHSGFSKDFGVWGVVCRPVSYSADLGASVCDLRYFLAQSKTKEVSFTDATWRNCYGAEVDATTSIAGNSVIQRDRRSLRRGSQAEVLFYEFQVPRKRALLIGDDDFQAKLHCMIAN